MVELNEYEKFRARPEGRPHMYQDWRDLLFLHYPVEPDALRNFIPEELEIDTWDGMAWVGLVPFWMKNVRFPGVPALPYLSRFPETNVRTYVHKQCRNPGVWFFSLDAARYIAAQSARYSYGLPYHHAHMTAERNGDLVEYRSKRVWRSGSVNIRAKLGKKLPHAERGSLEHFLIERYLLYAKNRGKLLSVQVHHQRYPLQEAELLHVEESLTKADGLEPNPYSHVIFSPGVDVELFARRPPR
ncbi:MAG TPA: DUF2071 domain-containing protein [Fimbriimonadaceae bacterium]|nr:DUF2071 domain-containing protein [Fimbriimonadaceae bacterium]